MPVKIYATWIRFSPNYKHVTTTEFIPFVLSFIEVAQTVKNSM